MDAIEDIFPIEQIDESTVKKPVRDEQTTQQKREEFSLRFGMRAFTISPEEKEAFIIRRKKEKRKKRVQAQKEKTKLENFQKKSRGEALPFNAIEEKKKLKSEENKILQNRFEIGQKIVFDLSFVQKEGMKELRSLGFQINHSYLALRKSQAEIAIHFTSYEGTIKTELEKLRADLWICGRHEQPIEEVFKDQLD